MNRPGIILYFSDWHTVARRLDAEQRGELITALMAFAETGEVPDICDQMTAFAFDMFAEKVTRDAENYRERCLKNAHNTYQRECKKHGETPLSFEKWLSSDTNRHRTITTDTETIQQELETETETEMESETETEMETETERELGKGTGKGTRERERENPELSDDEFNRKRYAAINALRAGF